jgi:hypothetical protein
VKRIRTTTVVLTVILLGLLYLLRLSYWPPGSVNMLVATDGTRIRGIQVEDNVDGVLWRITSDTGRLAGDLGVVTYGVVPESFAQEIPASGVPRPFILDEGLTIRVFTERMHLASRGRARGPESFLEVVWFDGPLGADLSMRPTSGGE